MASSPLRLIKEIGIQKLVSNPETGFQFQPRNWFDCFCQLRVFSNPQGQYPQPTVKPELNTHHPQCTQWSLLSCLLSAEPNPYLSKGVSNYPLNPYLSKGVFNYPLNPYLSKGVSNYLLNLSWKQVWGYQLWIIVLPSWRRFFFAGDGATQKLLGRLWLRFRLSWK